MKHWLVLLPLVQTLNLLPQPERSSVRSRNFSVSSARRPALAAPWRISGELPRYPRAPGGHPHHYLGVCRGPVSGGPASSLFGPLLKISSRRLSHPLFYYIKLSASFWGFPRFFSFHRRRFHRQVNLFRGRQLCSLGRISKDLGIPKS